MSILVILDSVLLCGRYFLRCSDHHFPSLLSSLGSQCVGAEHKLCLQSLEALISYLSAGVYTTTINCSVYNCIHVYNYNPAATIARKSRSPYCTYPINRYCILARNTHETADIYSNQSSTGCHEPRITQQIDGSYISLFIASLPRVGTSTAVREIHLLHLLHHLHPSPSFPMGSSRRPLGKVQAPEFHHFRREDLQTPWPTIATPPHRYPKSRW